MATTANSTLRTTGLSYDIILSDLVSFLKYRSDLEDYDYEDSAISSLVDLLSYNTYMNAFFTNMAVNEAFLDTAELKPSAISRAKALSYNPTSNRGASATIGVVWTQQANSTLTQLTINKHTKFTTTVNSISYDFVTPSSSVILANSSNIFAANVEVVEGTVLTHRYTVDSTSSSFIIPNANVDTTSITVNVVNNLSNVESYTPADDITQVKNDSLVYFLETEIDGRYKVQFGDNVIGKKPVQGANVHIEYRVSNGHLPNGANNFTLSGTIGGFSDVSLSIVNRASGGTGAEQIDSIKFNAPRLFETQNRAVTAKDYERIITRDNADIDSVSVWGGEENDPPIFGKVYMAVKPKAGILVSDTKKTDIRNSLKRYNILSIEPEFVDPTYLYLVPTITCRYNSRATSLTASQLQSMVSDEIVAYENDKLGKFENRTFYNSQFIREIDDVSEAIVSVDNSMVLEKRFNPSLTNKTTYKINFNNAIKQPVQSTGADGGHYLYSSSFGYGGQTCYFDDNGSGTLRIYYISTGTRVYLDRTAGTVDYSGGLVSVNSFLPTDYAGELKIQITPESLNIDSIRNQIMLIAGARVNIVDNDTGETVATTVVQTTSGVETTLLSSGIQAVVY